MQFCLETSGRLRKETGIRWVRGRSAKPNADWLSLPLHHSALTLRDGPKAGNSSSRQLAGESPWAARDLGEVSDINALQQMLIIPAAPSLPGLEGTPLLCRHLVMISNGKPPVVAGGVLLPPRSSRGVGCSDGPSQGRSHARIAAIEGCGAIDCREWNAVGGCQAAEVGHTIGSESFGILLA